MPNIVTAMRRMWRDASKLWIRSSVLLPPLALDTMSQAGHIAQIRSDPSLWRRRAGPACEPAREASWFSCNNPASNLAPAHIPRDATLPRLHTVPVVVPRPPVARPSTTTTSLRAPLLKKGPCSQDGVPLGRRRWIGRPMVTHSALDCWTLFCLSFINDVVSLWSTAPKLLSRMRRASDTLRSLPGFMSDRAVIPSRSAKLRAADTPATASTHHAAMTARRRVRRGVRRVVLSRPRRSRDARWHTTAVDSVSLRRRSGGRGGGPVVKIVARFDVANHLSPHTKMPVFLCSPTR